MSLFVGDEPGRLENRRQERVTAHFSVSFREVSDSEATLLAGDETSMEHSAPLPPVAKEEPGGSPSGVAGRSENLSNGGLSFSGDLQLLGDRKLEKGKKLLVEFQLPGEAKPVRALAVVAWSIQGSGEHGKFTAGLMFMGIGNDDLDKIQAYIAQQAPKG